MTQQQYIVTDWKHGETISVSISKSLSLHSRTRRKSAGTDILKPKECIASNSLETGKWFKTNIVFASKHIFQYNILLLLLHWCFMSRVNIKSHVGMVS